MSGTKTARPKTEAQLARERTAKKIARVAVADLPETEFGTGSKGHTIRANVVLPGGRKAFVNALVVYSDTVVKADKTTDA